MTKFIETYDKFVNANRILYFEPCAQPWGWDITFIYDDVDDECTSQWFIKTPCKSKEETVKYLRNFLDNQGMLIEGDVE